MTYSVKEIFYTLQGEGARRSGGQEKWEPRSGEPVFRPAARPKKT